jgi:hypothetical protein
MNAESAKDELAIRGFIRQSKQIPWSTTYGGADETGAWDWKAAATVTIAGETYSICAAFTPFGNGHRVEVTVTRPGTGWKRTYLDRGVLANELADAIHVQARSVDAAAENALLQWLSPQPHQ